MTGDVAVDLSELSDGELLELMVPVGSMSRRLLVVWLYLQERVSVPLKEFDKQLLSLAEVELQKRASDSESGEKLGQGKEILKKLGAKRGGEDSESEE